MRPIDADALTDYLKCLFPERGMWEIEGDTAKDAICETVVEAMEMVKNMETVKPKRMRGRWQVDPSGYGFWICSNCGFVSEASAADVLYKFCPNCGADMRGEQDG